MTAAATKLPGTTVMPADEALEVDEAEAAAVPDAPETLDSATEATEVAAEAPALVAELATDWSEATTPVAVPEAAVAAPICGVSEGATASRATATYQCQRRRRCRWRQCPKRRQ